jgi:hypothetical protein
MRMIKEIIQTRRTERFNTLANVGWRLWRYRHFPMEALEHRLGKPMTLSDAQEVI